MKNKKICQCINTFMTIGNIPTSFKESLTYEEQIIWLCNFLETEIIPSITKNSEDINELSNYLKNLDLQEEVNNKIDEMYESGLLSEIITQYLEISGLLSFDTLSDLEEATNIIEGSTAITLGRDEIGDGLGGIYKIREIKNTDVIDNYYIISLPDPDLVAELIPKNNNNLIMFDTLTDLKNANNLIKNMYVKTLGKLDIKDSLGSLYKIREVLNTDNIDEYYLIALADENLVAELIPRNITKNYILMADSYGNYTKNNVHYSWTENVISKLNLTSVVNLSVGSRGFAYNPAVGTFQQGLQTAVSNGTIANPEEIDEIILCGGANDMYGIATSNITQEDLHTAIANFFTYVHQTFPKASVKIGMVGNCKVGSYEVPYYQTLKEYQDCVNYGASYLHNVEYVLMDKSLLDDTDLHPTADGFNQLTNAICDAILSGSCNVKRESVTVSATSLTRTDGAWNIEPKMVYTQNNNIVELSSLQYGVAFRFNVGSRVIFDNITTDYNYQGYNLFPVCTLNNTSLRGGLMNNTYKAKLLGYVNTRFYMSNGKYLKGIMPLYMIGYNMYVGIPKNNTYAEAMLFLTVNAQAVSDITSLSVIDINLDDFHIITDVGSMDFIIA